MTMAKKKTQAQEEKRDQGDGKDGPKLADVVRQALGQLGTEASAGDVREWISRNYHGYTYNETTLGTTLSNQRKKLREASGSAIIATRVGKAALPGSSSVPSGEDLLKVKRIADKNGGIEELLKTVQTVHDLGAEVGGMDKLLRCLEMLHELIIK
jgi:hypothetical protein